MYATDESKVEKLKAEFFNGQTFARGELRAERGKRNERESPAEKTEREREERERTKAGE